MSGCVYVDFSGKKVKTCYQDLLVQWLRIHLPARGDLGWIPDQGKFHLPRGSYACIPQLLKPTWPRGQCFNKRSHFSEKLSHCNQRVACKHQPRPGVAKNKKMNFKKKSITYFGNTNHQMHKRIPDEVSSGTPAGLKGVPGKLSLVSGSWWRFTVSGPAFSDQHQERSSHLQTWSQGRKSSARTFLQVYATCKLAVFQVPSCQVCLAWYF